MTIKTLCSDMLLLTVFMLMGFFIREYIKPLQKLFLPASLIGGLLILPPDRGRSILQFQSCGA